MITPPAKGSNFHYARAGDAGCERPAYKPRARGARRASAPSWFWRTLGDTRRETAWLKRLTDPGDSGFVDKGDTGEAGR